MNALTPTLVGILLFVNHILSDILCCSIFVFRLMQHALQGRFAVQCTLLGGLPLGEDKLGARVRTLNTKVARRATIPPLSHNFALSYAVDTL